MHCKSIANYNIGPVLTYCAAVHLTFDLLLSRKLTYGLFLPLKTFAPILIFWRLFEIKTRKEQIRRTDGRTRPVVRLIINGRLTYNQKLFAKHITSSEIPPRIILLSATICTRVCVKGVPRCVSQ